VEEPGTGGGRSAETLGRRAWQLAVFGFRAHSGLGPFAQNSVSYPAWGGVIEIVSPTKHQLMALPGYRLFEVTTPDGKFHYTITIGDDGASGWLVTRITIKDWCHGGPLLIVSDIPQLPHWRNSAKPPKSKDHRVIKPAFIGRIIRRAIDLGWSPKEGSGQFSLSLHEHPVS